MHNLIFLLTILSLKYYFKTLKGLLNWTHRTPVSISRLTYPSTAVIMLLIECLCEDDSISTARTKTLFSTFWFWSLLFLDVSKASYNFVSQSLFTYFWLLTFYLPTSLWYVTACHSNVFFFNNFKHSCSLSSIIDNIFKNIKNKKGKLTLKNEILLIYIHHFKKLIPCQQITTV